MDSDSWGEQRTRGKAAVLPAGGGKVSMLRVAASSIPSAPEEKGDGSSRGDPELTGLQATHHQRRPTLTSHRWGLGGQ